MYAMAQRNETTDQPARATDIRQATPLKVLTNPDWGLKKGGEPNDRQIASKVLGAIHALQDVLDEAALAGLMVEPSFTRCSNRFAELGSDADTFVAQVDIFRKLA